MQQVITIIFWISLALLLYGYLGYGLILTIINRYKKKPIQSLTIEEFPSIAFIVAAYNEENIIEQKINNSLELTYPQNKIKYYFITDGSTDNTYSICLKYKKIITYHINERLGKLASLQRIIPDLKEDILVLSDANCMINQEALQHLLPHFIIDSVGAVSGEKKVKTDADAVGSEGVYWMYESWLKNQDARFNSLVGAAGELLCIRRKLYTRLPENLILEDFVQTMKICEQGYKVQYEERAYSTESSSINLKEEFKRKSRICAGAFQSFSHIGFAFNPIRYPTIFFQFLSHRFFRWVIGPVLLPVFFVSNYLLADSCILYSLLFIAQITFYGLSIIGLSLSFLKIKGGPIFLPLYFVLMNGAVFTGFYKYIKGRQSSVWEKSQRKTNSNPEK